MVLLGRLNTSPRQAHLIVRFLKTLCKTPMILTVITTKVTVLIRMGLKPVKNATPNASSVKAYI